MGMPMDVILFGKRGGLRKAWLVVGFSENAGAE